jgi:hypothetical protein
VKILKKKKQDLEKELLYLLEHQVEYFIICKIHKVSNMIR